MDLRRIKKQEHDAESTPARRSRSSFDFLTSNWIQIPFFRRPQSIRSDRCTVTAAARTIRATRVRSGYRRGGGQAKTDSSQGKKSIFSHEGSSISSFSLLFNYDTFTRFYVEDRPEDQRCYRSLCGRTQRRRRCYCDSTPLETNRQSSSNHRFSLSLRVYQDNCRMEQQPRCRTQSRSQLKRFLRCSLSLVGPRI